MTIQEFVWHNQGKELPMQEVEILTGVEPKYKCKNKLLQKVLIKLFGHVSIYEKRQARMFVCKAEDYPRNFDGSLTIEIGKQYTPDCDDKCEYTKAVKERNKSVEFIKYLDKNYSSYMTEKEKFGEWRNGNNK